MYNYYKIEEQHVEEVSKFLSEKEIPFVNLEDPTRFVCERTVNSLIESYNDGLKPIFRKIEEDLVDEVTSKFNDNIFINTGFDQMISESIEKITNKYEKGE